MCVERPEKVNLHGWEMAKKNSESRKELAIPD
jgi:hypothetical protein